LKLGHERLPIDGVEKNRARSGDMQLFVSFDEVNEATLLDRVVLPPIRANIGTVFVNVFLFVKRYFSGTECHDDLVVNHEQLTERFLSQDFDRQLFRIAHFRFETFSLPIEKVDSIFFFLVECFQREVEDALLDNGGSRFANNLVL